jgi:hypothetical protein
MVKLLNVGDYVVTDTYKGVSLAKVKDITLLRDDGLETGMYVPSITYLYGIPDSNFRCNLYEQGEHPALIRTREHRRSDIRLLVGHDKRDLDIYFSGNFERYALIINNPLLKEAVIERLKTNTKPHKNGFFL